MTVSFEAMLCNDSMRNIFFLLPTEVFLQKMKAAEERFRAKLGSSSPIKYLTPAPPDGAFGAKPVYVSFMDEDKCEHEGYRVADPSHVVPYSVDAHAEARFVSCSPTRFDF